MSVRGVSRLATCRTIPTRWTSSRQCGACSLQPTWLVQTTSISLPQLHARGAKTKTVIKARDLPQGALPPLPKDESDGTPARTYPVTLQQHLNNIRKFKDCIVLTRVGDFYEMYFDQVDEYAHLLGLKKAKRKTAVGNVAMAGFQHWQLERYMKIIVQDLGKQVAISEQVPIPVDERAAKGNGPQYDRKVVRVVSPGTLIDESFLDPLENNYLLAVHLDGAIPLPSTNSSQSEAYNRYKRTTKVGLSWVDLSSGDFFTQVSDLASLPSLVTRIRPKEIVLNESMESTGETELQKLLGDGGYSLHFHQITSPASSVDEWTSRLERPIPEKQQLQFTNQELAAGNLVLDCVREKLQDTAIQLQPPVRRSDDEFMAIDKQSLRGLEIRSLLRDGTFKGCLLHAIRRTVTKSGARLLSQRIISPSMSLSVINNRLDLVQEMLQDDALREDLQALLGRTSDTCRLLQRFSINRGDADDLLGLARTVEVMGQVSEVLHDHIIATQDNADGEETELGCLWDILDRLDLEGPSRAAKAILAAIDEEGLTRQHTREDESREEAVEMADEVMTADAAGEKGPSLARRASKSKPAATSASAPDTSEDIWIMRSTASQTLQLAHHDLSELLEEKQELTLRLRHQLKADSLTLQWGPKSGHFCHIKGKDIRANISALEGTRSIAATKSTRTFLLEEWSYLGVRIDNAKLRIRVEEERVFDKLRAQVIENLMKLRRNAAVLDELDLACSSAIVAKERNLIRPILHEGTSHKIIGGRHPTVDVGLREQGRLFAANDCSVGEREKIYLITGPNMGGKSTYLRQNALITILAQTGCFIPADYAEIGLVDKIFSRVGSADNLYQDQSTFMVEMLETASILQQATERSLVIMDEVGRGTTPEDGIAMGYACLYHLHYVNKCRTLFATHFHSLADMTADFDNVGYYCTDVAEDGDGWWAYVHKLRKGVNRESHALKVARLAGIPEEAIAVAGDALAEFQRSKERGGISEQMQRPLLAVAG